MDRQALSFAVGRMARHFGPLGWWPADSPFEVVVGAVLTQNTAWRRVEVAIEKLRRARRLDPHALAALDVEEIAELIRPAGTFRVKARYLKGLVTWLTERYGGDLGAALAGDTGEKREELLSLPGVGRETADSILLYAGGHPVFVVDAYTRRVFGRHGLVDPRADYDEIREQFEASLPRDPAAYNEIHAGIVNLGKDYCRPRGPRCPACPLFDLFSRLGHPPPPDARG